MTGREKPPSAAAQVVQEALETARENGHSFPPDPAKVRWVRTSRRVYCAECACTRLLIVSDTPSLSWRFGGRALTEACDA